jgi:uncharacterized membrane protein
MQTIIKKYTAAWVLIGVLFCIMCVPSGIALAQEVHNEYQGTWRGEVVEVLSQESIIIPGTETESTVQTINFEIIDGPQEGDFVTIENDYLVLEAGDSFYFNHNVYIDGSVSYAVTNIDRRGALTFFILLFVVVVVAFGGWQGVRSLVALGGSFVAIFYVLLPGLVAGYNPLLLSMLVASGVLFAAIFFTHGFNRESVVAYGGTMLAVLLTSVVALFAVFETDLTGFVSDESVFLNFATDGVLDFTGLLLGAIIIGVLGVLDDIAVTQAAVVTELFQSNKSLTRKQVYQKAVRVGKEHVSALVNTLVLAYVGASLPLLMYFHLSPLSFWSLVNSELFATEIIRAIVGSIGLIMTVPIVTGLAVYYLRGYTPTHSHSHSHSHSHGHVH